jgi:ferredoxin-NADP reductase
MWQLAEVVALRTETARTRSITLSVPDWPGHRSGQHVDVRLTADDGYQAERSYSIASAPEDGSRVTLSVERVENGEVSPYLVDELRIGDTLELRGPIGGYFVWEATIGGPLLLVAGGSGIAPLMAMLRHRAATRSNVAVRLLYSARSEEDVIYRDELARLPRDGLATVYTLTRSQPQSWTGYRRRVDADMLREVA